ncbi:MAG: GIY-YIG nuclease family protein [Myxococcales bacterium]|nr:MAG: GIY-YIG nuclease family protein [Myxococcales bacterium]
MANARVWFVYMIRCADGTLYTGSTTDLARRFAEHASGRGARYTASRRPLRLVWAERRPDRSQAQRREAEMKNLSREAKLKNIRNTPCLSLARFVKEPYPCARFAKQIK